MINLKRPSTDFDPTASWEFYASHFGGTSISPFGSEVAGAGSSCVVNTSNIQPGRPGIVILTTGTTATGRAAASLSWLKMSPITSGKFGILLRQLSSGTDEYKFRVGFHNSRNSSEPTNGTWFEYDRTTSTNWILKSANTSGSSSADSGVEVLHNTWFDFSFDYDSAQSKVVYQINRVNVGTISSDLANNTTLVEPCAAIVKSVGTTNCVADIDYFYGRGDR